MSPVHVIDYRGPCGNGHPDAQWRGTSDDPRPTYECPQCDPPPAPTWARGDDRRRRA